MPTFPRVISPGRRLARRAGLSLSGGLTLAAVVAVLFFVSLPRLRDLTVHENERDALSTARSLAAALGAGPGPDGVTMDLLVERAALAPLVPDAEFLEGGRVMRSNGYLFTPVELPAGHALTPWGAWGLLRSVLARETGAARGIVAWPCVRGHTGSVALLATAGGEVLGNPNERASWEGLAHRPRLGRTWRGQGWRSVR